MQLQYYRNICKATAEVNHFRGDPKTPTQNTTTQSVKRTKTLDFAVRASEHQSVVARRKNTLILSTPCLLQHIIQHLQSIATTLQLPMLETTPATNILTQMKLHHYQIQLRILLKAWLRIRPQPRCLASGYIYPVLQM
jgi:hypothetical protein